MTLVNDPVLGVLASRDPELHRRVSEALLGLGGNCALAMARYQGLPSNLLRVAASPDRELRSTIASRPDCPAEVLEELARDADDGVRREVAGNEATPATTLALLASDADQWVRFDAFHNPAATDEVRALVALLSTSEDLTRRRMNESEDPATPPERLRQLAVASLADTNDYPTRSKLAENPSFPDDAIPMLVEAASHRWEWRSLWSRRSALAGMQAAWPSTIAFTVPEVPDWIISALVGAGHPAALLRVDCTGAVSSVDAPDAMVQLVNSELLIRALWREMALAGAVELVYWNDSFEGDHFFPTSPTIELMDAGTAAEYLVAGYSNDREWVGTTDSLPLDNVIRLAAQLWEDWSGVIDDYTDDDLDLFTLTAAAYAVDNPEVDGPGIELSVKGKHALARLIDTEQIVAESDDFDTAVAVRESALPQIGYAATSDDHKRALVRLIQESRSDPMLSAWGISDHFLKCIALHPATPDDIRSLLSEDESPEVRDASQAGMGGAQAGVVGPSPVGGASDELTVGTVSAINTFVFSTLIPEGRFEEARIWLQQGIDSEAPYESWNARSNLGVLEFMTGHEDEARRQFEMVLASEDGPGFEAEEYLDRLEAGELPETIGRLEYSEDWCFEEPLLAAAGADQRTQYLRFIRILAEPENGPTFKEKWLMDPGGFATGFLDGAFEMDGVIESGMERETAAKALADYMEWVLLESPAPDEAGGMGAVKLAAGDRDAAEGLLRRAASAGDAQAALMLGTLLAAIGRERQSRAWLNVARSLNG